MTCLIGLWVSAGAAPAFCQAPPPPEPSEPDVEAEGRRRGPVFTTQLQVLAEFDQLGRRESLFNPQNRIAALPGRQVLMEVRPDFSVRYGPVEVAASPRAYVARRFDPAPPGTAGDSADEAYLYKWRVQAQVTPALSLSYGRQVMQWGNGVFRSVSNPFLADNGRLNPIRELPAAEFAILTYTPSLSYAVSVLSNTGDGRTVGAGRDRFRATHAVKFDYVGDSINATLVASKKIDAGVRLGAASTYTASEALLLYGEASAVRGSDALVPTPAASGVGWDLVRRDRSERIFFANLVGASFTFGNGLVLTAEYVYNNEGYGSDESRAFGLLASSAAGALRDGGPMAEQGARLLGQAFDTGLRFERRNYAFLQLLRTEYRNRMDLAVSYTANLDGGGGMASSYVTYSLTDRSQGYFVAASNLGGAQTEFARLQRYSFASGVRWFF